jgi:hypothetical protein
MAVIDRLVASHLNFGGIANHHVGVYARISRRCREPLLRRVLHAEDANTSRSTCQPYSRALPMLTQVQPRPQDPLRRTGG